MLTQTHKVPPPKQRLNCLYYDVVTGGWMPGAALYRFRRISDTLLLVGHATTPQDWNLLHLGNQTCSCDKFFFQSVGSGPAQPCRHLRLAAILLGQLKIPVSSYTPRQAAPLTSTQKLELEKRLSPNIEITPLPIAIFE